MVLLLLIALKKYGIHADLLPEIFTGEGLAGALIAEGVTGKKILLPRALKAREILPESLRDGRAEVVVAPVYQNLPPKDDEEKLRTLLNEKQVDMVTFTSSSTVTNFIQMLGASGKNELEELMTGVQIASIGPITSKTIVKNGLSVDVQPEKYTIPDLIEAIVSSYNSG